MGVGDPVSSGIMSAVSLQSTWTRLILWLGILGVAFGIRAWGLDYGLPHATARPDEERVVGRALTVLATGSLLPGDFTYPAFLKYLNALAMALYFVAGKLFGRYDKLLDFLFDAAVLRPGLEYSIARVVSVLLGVATVPATYVLAREAYRSRGVGLVAATAAGTCYLHVRDSHFATVDVGMTFLVTVSLVFAVRAARDYRTLDFVLAGLFAGLAAATKYNAGMVILALGAAAWPWFWREGRSAGTPRRGWIMTRFILAGAAMAAAAVLASPYTFLHYPATWRELGEIRRLLHGGTGPLALWIHLGVTFPVGLGWPFFLTAVAGTARAAWLRRSGDLVLLAFLVPWLVSAASVRWVFPRYLVPLVPVLAVLAAEFVHVELSRSRILPALTATGVLAAPGVWRSVAFDRVASQEDTRLVAAQWVAEHVPPRSPILVCRGYGAPAINTDRRRPPAFEPLEVDCARGDFPVVGEPSPRYWITHEHVALRHYSRVAPQIAQRLAQRGKRLLVIDPFKPGRERDPYFYPGDAFYLPMTALDAMEGGGPTITIWEWSPSDP